jgi:hypothetical protein
MPVRVPELTTCIDHPPPPWLRHGETHQPPQRDDELAISCDARTGPQHWAGGLSAHLTAARRCTRRSGRPVIDYFRKRRGPPWAVGVTKLGSALFKRTGADARIISTVNPHGFEYRS